jgi:tetratricopeptide (TPR) repeat protein
MIKRNSQNHGRAVLGILLIVFLVYAPSLKNGFVNWDDDAHLLLNPFVQRLDLRSVRDIFSTTVNKIYIPLTLFSFALERHFFGDDPFVYHLDNLVLHLAVTALVYYFALGCGVSRKASAFSALIFGIHPIHVESVAWVAERKDVLYAFFYMLALVSYQRHLRACADGIGPASPKRFFAASVLSGIFSALAKPMALSLPLIFILMDWFSGRRWISWRAMKEKIYCAVFMVPIIWMTYALHMRAPELRWPDSALTWVWCFAFYARKFFLPDYFVLIYKLPVPVSIMNASYAGAIIIFILFSISLFVFRRKRIFMFLNLFYFLSIFFLLRFDISADVNVAADRFSYLPVLGWCVLLGIGWDRLSAVWAADAVKARVLLWFSVAVVVFLSFQTVRQCRVWRNGVSLWEHQLRGQPQAATALIYEKLAQAYVMEGGFDNDPGKVQQIKDYFHRAIGIKPDYAAAYYGLGDLYVRLGQPEPALRYFLKAITFDHGHFEAYYQAGRLYSGRGEYPTAVDAFNKAVEINPDNERMYDKIIQFYAGQIAGGRGGETYRQANRELNEKFNEHVFYGTK